MSHFALVGHPVSHSLSPEIHRAAYRALGAEHVYELVDAPDEAAVARVVDALRAGELAGVNVTIPWKRVALALADRVAPSAQDTGAANVLERGSDGLVAAHNTDVPALVDELGRLAPGARSACVIGNGGAASAAVAACRALGVARIVVVARRWEPAVEAGFARLGATPTPWGTVPASSGVVIQATSAGMLGADPGETVRDIVPWRELARDAAAFDVVYNPALTPFLAAARAAGLAAEGGLGMLVGQAALALGIWLGAVPPRAPLRDAAERALATRGAA